MEKIEEIDMEKGRMVGTLVEVIAEKLNAVIQVVNNSKCAEIEEPIYETLDDNDVLIISKNEEGLLVVSNRNGNVQIERVKYPEDG